MVYRRSPPLFRSVLLFFLPYHPAPQSLTPDLVVQLRTSYSSFSAVWYRLTTDTLAPQVTRTHAAGSKITVCFSSCYDACAGAIAGVLRTVPSPQNTAVSDTSYPTPAPPLRPAGNIRISASSRSSSARKSISTSSVRVVTKRSADVGCAEQNASPGSVVALLFDEVPKHKNRCGTGTDDSSDCMTRGEVKQQSLEGTDTHLGGVSTMGVQEWVEVYGECDGPMLAAWVYSEQASAD